MLAILLFASALLVVQATYEHRSRLARLFQLKTVHHIEEARRMQLLLQQGTLTNHARIARLARIKFGMHPPHHIQLIIVGKR
jgi:cell division protein FtsL